MDRGDQLLKKKHKCAMCSASLSSKTNLKRHVMYIHNSENAVRFRCNTGTCEKSFTSKHKLNMHIRAVHQKIREFQCKTCFNTFAYQNNLKTHEKTVHGGREKNFKCTQCPRAYIIKAYLQKHMKTHTGDKEFKCLTCDAAFYTNREKHIQGKRTTSAPCVMHDIKEVAN